MKILYMLISLFLCSTFVNAMNKDQHLYNDFLSDSTNDTFSSSPVINTSFLDSLERKREEERFYETQMQFTLNSLNASINTHSVLSNGFVFPTIEPQIGNRNQYYSHKSKYEIETQKNLPYPNIDLPPKESCLKSLCKCITRFFGRE